MAGPQCLWVETTFPPLPSNPPISFLLLLLYLEQLQSADLGREERGFSLPWVLPTPPGSWLLLGCGPWPIPLLPLGLCPRVGRSSYGDSWSPSHQNLQNLPSFSPDFNELWAHFGDLWFWGYILKMPFSPWGVLNQESATQTAPRCELGNEKPRGEGSCWAVLSPIGEAERPSSLGGSS